VDVLADKGRAGEGCAGVGGAGEGFAEEIVSMGGTAGVATLFFLRGLFAPGLMPGDCVIKMPRLLTDFERALDETRILQVANRFDMNRLGDPRRL
jgi:hypothetical protein